MHMLLNAHVLQAGLLHLDSAQIRSMLNRCIPACAGTMEAIFKASKIPSCMFVINFLIDADMFSLYVYDFGT